MDGLPWSASCCAATAKMMPYVKIIVTDQAGEESYFVSDERPIACKTQCAKTYLCVGVTRASLANKTQVQPGIRTEISTQMQELALVRYSHGMT